MAKVRGILVVGLAILLLIALRPVSEPKNPSDWAR